MEKKKTISLQLMIKNVTMKSLFLEINCEKRNTTRKNYWKNKKMKKVMSKI